MGFQHLSYQEQDAFKIGVTIAILFLIGGLFLLKQYDYDPEKWSLKNHSPEKTIRAIGCFWWGVALSLVPSLIGALIGEMWLVILTVVIFLAVCIVWVIIERKGFLKPTDEG